MDHAVSNIFSRAHQSTVAVLCSYLYCLESNLALMMVHRFICGTNAGSLEQEMCGGAPMAFTHLFVAPIQSCIRDVFMAWHRHDCSQRAPLLLVSNSVSDCKAWIFYRSQLPSGQCGLQSGDQRPHAQGITDNLGTCCLAWCAYGKGTEQAQWEIPW
jgi:hypothetical protein